MGTSRRRSSRRLSGLPTPSIGKSTATPNKLSSLIERDESPNNGPSAIDALVSSPTVPNTAPNTTRFGMLSSAVQSPQTASRILPSNNEMHPSKVHQSTKKPSQSQGPLSSHPINQMPRSPSKIAIATGTYRTPTKASASKAHTMTSATFDFSFGTPEANLSDDARKIMDSVREEAAKIKAQLKAVRANQDVVDEEANKDNIISGRQIRKSKGKSGRFSEVHREQFKMMDSIANHGSTWKTKLQNATSSPLKRSPSKAGLDETPKSMPRSKSYKGMHDDSSDRLENPTPGKRAKRDRDQDTSTARPTSQDSKIGPGDLQQLPSAATTPTKASLARSASVRSLKKTMIPSLTKSMSMKALRGPVVPMSEPSNKRQRSWSRFGGNVKSILSRAQPKFSDDPMKIAAGTHLPLPKEKPDVQKALPSLPGSPTIKQVNFTPSTKARHEAASIAASQTPSKISITQTNEQHTTTIIPLNDAPITYPDLTQSPNVTTTRGRSPKPASASRQSLETPGDFTFRSETADGITFNTNNGPTVPVTSPPHNSNTPRRAARTIRPVRPSGAAPSTTLPGSFPAAPLNLPAGGVEHGISNKKRKHDTSSDADEEENAENVDPSTTQTQSKHGSNEDGPKAKKQRTTQPELPKATKTAPSGRRQTGFGAADNKNISPQKKKGGLSLSRLNMLARPKQR